MIEAENLVLTYEDAGQAVRAVDGVSLSLARGFWGICGPSGSGKSTLLYLLAGLKVPQSGEVRLGGRPLSPLSIDERAEVRRTRFGFVFQNPFLVPYLTILENVLVLGPEDRKRAEDLLVSLELAHARDRFPWQVSAGERQRAAVARAVFHRPDVVFADEPTASLDRENADRVVALLRRHTADGTLVVVTHDETILGGADGVYRMYGGRIAT